MVHHCLVLIPSPHRIRGQYYISKLDLGNDKVLACHILVDHDLTWWFTPDIDHFFLLLLRQSIEPLKILGFRNKDNTSFFHTFLQLSGCPCSYVVSLCYHELGQFVPVR
ncbi:MAG: hypothetical protein C5S40_00200 [ANME-2 cluster archaeon]|nr:hypothetical protein [ANME-2 cluster archaeon]